MNSATPRLSVILTTRADSESLRLVLRCLRAQTVAPALECLVVTSSDSTLELPQEESRGLWSGRVIKLASVTSEGRGKTVGVAEAQAPLVAFTEDHCYPEPTWGEALLRAHHSGEFAAVGPVVLNANPRSPVSWGIFLVFYGPFMAPAHADAEMLPGNQSCYRREVLLEYGDRLAEMLECESLLHWDLHARGHRLRQEPLARVHHLNHSRILPLLEETCWASRTFGGLRASGWGAAKRAFYAAGSALLPAIRLRRVLAQARGVGLPGGTLRRALPTAALTLCASAAGEMLGYVAGPGRASQQVFRPECRPYAGLTPEVAASVARMSDAR